MTQSPLWPWPAAPADEPAGRVLIDTRDCNAAAERAHDLLFGSSGGQGVLGLAVIDNKGFQMSFDAIERLTTGARVDLLIVFMTYAAKRFLRNTPDIEKRLDRYFGAGHWRDLRSQLASPSDTTTRGLLDLYEDRLRTLG